MGRLLTIGRALAGEARKAAVALFGALVIAGAQGLGRARPQADRWRGDPLSPAGSFVR